MRTATSVTQKALQGGWGNKQHATFQWWELKLLDELDNGHLLEAANRAVRNFGHGRIHNPDGSLTDIGHNVGGTTRTILDNYEPVDIPTSESEPEASSPTEPLPSPSPDSDLEVKVF